MNVVWTNFAMDCERTIYEYQLRKNGVKRAKKIRQGIKETPRILYNHPTSGKIEELLNDLNLGHRFLLSKSYKIIYRIEKENIYITDVFETHQDSKKLEKRNISYPSK